MIEVNGIKYESRKSDNSKKPKHLSKMMLVAQMLGGFSQYGSSDYTRELPSGINLIDEYGKIQRKESKLSRWERDKIVRMFEKKYKSVTKEGNEG